MDQLPDLSDTSVEWWQYVLAVVLVIAGFIVAGFARRGALRLLQRTPGVSEPLADVTSRFASYLVVFLGVGIALAVIGVNIQPVLAIALIVVVIAALVLKGLSDNFAAGVMLQASHPIVPGDEIFVEIPDGTATGIVTELRSRTVVIRTYDGRTVHVPNGHLVSDSLVVSPAGGARRSDVQVRLERGSHPVDDLLAQLTHAAGSVGGVLDSPALAAAPVTISPDRLTARVRFWHRNEDTASAVAAVVSAVSAHFEGAGLTVTVTSEPAIAPLTPPDAI